MRLTCICAIDQRQEGTEFTPTEMVIDRGSHLAALLRRLYETSGPNGVGGHRELLIRARILIT